MEALPDWARRWTMGRRGERMGGKGMGGEEMVPRLR